MERLSEIYVKPDLHAKITKLKGNKTSDQYLRELLIKENGDRKDPHLGMYGKKATKPAKPGVS